MANTNKRPEEVPEQRIKLTVNYLTDEDYESIDKTRLSTELSNQLFMTPGNGGHAFAKDGTDVYALLMSLSADFETTKRQVQSLQTQIDAMNSSAS